MEKKQRSLSEQLCDATNSACIDHGKTGFGRGYASVFFQGKMQRAHRISYIKHHSLKIEDIQGMMIRHKCDNPRCINPLHLEPGTAKDNHDDMKKRGRRPKHTYPSLTKDQVAFIRANCAPGVWGNNNFSNENSINALAKRFGVARSCVWKAYKGHEFSFPEDS